MANHAPTFREIAKILADNAQMILMSSCDEALDGDQVEELSMMFQEELNKLNGNI